MLRPFSRPLLSLFFCTSFALFTGCGGDGDGPADASPGGDAAASPDGGADDTFTLHYHRPDGDYAGWVAELGGGAAMTRVEASGTDGFGAVYTIALSPGATALTYRFTKEGEADPAEARSITLSEAAAASAWHFSGWDRTLLRAPGGIPGPGQVAIYYLRADGAYDGWGLHLWGDVARETQWAFPAIRAGIDPDFGAYWLADVKDAAERINVIVHMGDTKDPGPDMGWNISELGTIVFLRTKSAEISPIPVEVPSFSIEGAKAFWLDRTTIAWSFDDQPAVSFELRASSDATIRAVDAEVTGGEVHPLTLDPAGLPMALATAWPHLARLKVLKLTATASVADLLRGQLVVVARDAEGVPLAATAVQTAGVIDALHTYDGPLGVTFAGRVPAIRVWAPTAQEMALIRFDANLSELERLPMTRGARGVWSIDGTADWYGTYYQYEVKVYHPISGRIETTRATDPYSVSVSADGRHTQIVDLDDPATQPPGWDALMKPALAAPEDISIYELHVRDFSANDPTVPMEHRGKFLAFTHNGEGGRQETSGMRHLEALQAAGLNTIHLLPSFDLATVPEVSTARVDLDDPFGRLCEKNMTVPTSSCAAYGTTPIREVLASRDPTGPEAQQIVTWMRSLDSFNWGYDPHHYTVPEGSYATEPTGTTRILEFRRMVQALAESGLRIALDVVYNHTNAAGVQEKSVLDKLVPGYYHRLNVDSGFVEQSTCCPNTATEHAMMERLMIDSLVTWAQAYKIDAFRFDLMGHHMKRNMTQALAAVRALNTAEHGVDGSQIYFYGEGWNFGEVANNARGINATQLNMAGTGIGTFNDRLRDAARGGGPFDSGQELRSNQGFLNGLGTAPNEVAAAMGQERLLEASDLIRVTMAGNLRTFRLVNRAGRATTGGQVGYNGAMAGYTDDPQESIVYVDKHDNQTLFDINAYKAPRGLAMEERVRMQNLGVSLVAMSQGIPFFHAGMDLLRSKSMERDSYDSGDWFNRLDFSYQTNNWKVGLPNQEKDVMNWPLIRQIFADRSISPEEQNIRRAAEHFREMLAVRSSSELFRLRTGDEVRQRVDFHNTGPGQEPGLIAMSITDGTCAGADLDPAIDGVLVLINASPEDRTLAAPDGSTGLELHPVLAASSDPVVRAASLSAGMVTVPGRTTAVFVLPQGGAQGAGLPCNTR